MSTAKELLGFSFDATQFKLQGQTIITPYTIRLLERANKGLEEITRAHQSFSNEQPEDASIYRLFMGLAEHRPEDLDTTFDTPRMARNLAWSLCFGETNAPWISQTRHLPLALNLLSKNARPGVLLGLFDALLQNWETPASADLLRQFLRPKVQAYAGRRRAILNLKQNTPFYFGASGAVKLGGSLAVNGTALSHVWQMLSLPSHMQAYPYFTEVAAAYTQTVLRTSGYAERIPHILSFLTVHNRSEADKQCLAKIIIKLENAPDDDLRNSIETFSFEKIGDPTQDHRWMSCVGATPEQIVELKKAQSILNHWIVRRFIVAFFDKVAMDRDRKEFWLPYAKHVTRFKVFSTNTTLYRLQGDKRLKPFITGRFGHLSGTTSALMMQIKSKTIVEFSVTGNACYVYNNDDITHLWASDRNYYTIGMLKHKKVPLLFNYSGSYLYNEKKVGRFSHTEGWQDRARKWLRNHLRI